MSIRDDMAADLSLPDGFVDKAVNIARSRVKYFTIEKCSGGERVIIHPSRITKTIQYWLIHKIFKHIPPHEAAVAYREKMSIRHNAIRHRWNKYFLRMDLENFFPSICFNDLWPILKDWSSNTERKWCFDDDSNELIRLVCFYKDDCLAIGYPSSPIISNIVMREFDKKVSEMIDKKELGEVVYTRYADDLVFSTNKKGACTQIMKEVQKIIRESKSPRIKVNRKKTRFGSSTGGSASVTGLKICSGGHITIHRKQKDHIRLLLSLYRKGKLNPEKISSLLGHLSYCHHVAPKFYTTISKKYFKEIHRLRADASKASYANNSTGL